VYADAAGARETEEVKQRPDAIDEPYSDLSAKERETIEGLSTDLFDVERITSQPALDRIPSGDDALAAVLQAQHSGHHEEALKLLRESKSKPASRISGIGDIQDCSGKTILYVPDSLLSLKSFRSDEMISAIETPKRLKRSSSPDRMLWTPLGPWDDTMKLVLEAIPVPLNNDGHGGLRVGQTRVTLESVWHLHRKGASPAEIVQAFDTLQTADVYAVLAWALRHREEVDAYLKRRDEEAAQLRRQMEEVGLTPTRQESAKLKEKLEARRRELQRQGTGDAAFSDG
jgi:uncharacterized protein (DUF433 family)